MIAICTQATGIPDYIDTFSLFCLRIIGTNTLHSSGSWARVIYFVLQFFLPTQLSDELDISHVKRAFYDNLLELVPMADILMEYIPRVDTTSYGGPPTPPLLRSHLGAAFDVHDEIGRAHV